MKKILTILFIPLSIKGYSQSTTPQFLGGKNSNLVVQSVFNMADSPKASFNLILPDTTTAKTYFSGNLKGRWARQNGRLMYNPTGLKFVNADSVTSGGGGSTDTTSLSNRIDLKLNIIDTANMRIRPIAGSNMTISGTYPNITFASSGGASIDTTSLSTRIDARVKYTDTPTMLAPYALTSELTNQTGSDGSLKSLTITGTNGSGHIHLRHQSVDATATGSSTVLFADVNGDLKWKNDGGFYTTFRDYLNTADRVYSFQNKNYTVADSADVSSKLNISDTASMLAGYLRDADTAAMLANYYDVRDTGRSSGSVVTGGSLAKVTDSLGALIGGGGVSAASVAEINTGTDNTKFASPLGLEGSKYLEQDNAKLYATTTGTSTAYVLATTPSFTPTTGTLIYVKFHVANTGAATINVNGSGAVALQKDLSTALVANDIPINIEYTIRRTTTGWLVTDIGFAGINLSARLLGALSDETGTGVAVFGTTPTFTTSVLGGATFSAFNTVTTNLSLGGAATTMTIGGTPTTALTATFFGNATATATTKTGNFFTGGASGSTTALNFGSATSGATNNIKMNITPASDATGDIWYRNASGFMTRLGIGTTGQVLTVAAGLPSWATAGAGSGWGLTGNSGTTAGTNFVGTTDAVRFDTRADNRLKTFIPTGYSTAQPSLGTTTGASFVINTGLDDQVRFGLLMGTDENGRAYAQSQNHLTSAAYPFSINGRGGSVDIGTLTSDASAVVNIVSTTQGLLIPRMTGTQADAIPSKTEGLMVYVTTATGSFSSKGWYGWNGTIWEKFNP